MVGLSILTAFSICCQCMGETTTIVYMLPVDTIEYPIGYLSRPMETFVTPMGPMRCMRGPMYQYKWGGVGYGPMPSIEHYGALVDISGVPWCFRPLIFVVAAFWSLNCMLYSWDIFFIAAFQWERTLASGADFSKYRFREPGPDDLVRVERKTRRCDGCVRIWKVM
jgi:hypothetical protein